MYPLIGNLISTKKHEFYMDGENMNIMRSKRLKICPQNPKIGQLKNEIGHETQQ
jgi:hypothetical protein